MSTDRGGGEGRTRATGTSQLSKPAMRSRNLMYDRGSAVGTMIYAQIICQLARHIKIESPCFHRVGASAVATSDAACALLPTRTSRVAPRKRKYSASSSCRRRAPVSRMAGAAAAPAAAARQPAVLHVTPPPQNSEEDGRR